MMRILAPSLLGTGFKHVEQEIQAVEKAGAQHIHLDVMDGAFVPSISFGMPVIVSLGSCMERVFGVHMTVERPERYIDDIRVCGADAICIHVEACIHLGSAISRIKTSGARAGVTLNPAAPIHVLEQILPQMDMVLIMAVNPGFGGQSFTSYTLEKVRALRTWYDNLGLTMDTEVDGGISVADVHPVLEAGANIIVAGSAVFKGDIYKDARRLMELLREYERWKHV